MLFTTIKDFPFFLSLGNMLHKSEDTDEETTGKLSPANEGYWWGLNGDSGGSTTPTNGQSCKMKNFVCPGEHEKLDVIY